MNPSAAMPAFVKLLVTDAARSRAFYDALGFELVFADSLFTHLRWGPGADVFLVTAPAGREVPAPRGAGVLICFTVGALVARPSVDALAATARAQVPVPVVDGPRDQPWFTREVVVMDPDGYRVAFVEPR